MDSPHGYRLRIVSTASSLERGQETILMPIADYAGPLPAVGDHVVVQNCERIVRRRIFGPYEPPAGYPDGLVVTLVVYASPKDTALQEI